MTLAGPADPAATARPRWTHRALHASFTVGPCEERGAVRERDARRVSEMRRLVRAHLASCGMRALADDVELMVSELLTNSLVHSGSTALSMVLRVSDDLLHMQVFDGVRREPTLRARPCADAESGRGLDLVDAIVRARQGAWGLSPGGTLTWCTLPVEGEGS